MPPLKRFSVPAEFTVKDVEFPDRGQISIGQPDIRFSKKGYSDMALIHVELSDNSQRSFLIEPFLPRVKLYAENISFQE